MFELFMARRYLVPKRGRGFLSLITWISVGGVFLGVLALIVVLAVMNGFEREVKTRIVGTNAHIVLLRYGSQGLSDPDTLVRRVEAEPGVTSAAPFVYGKVMISAGSASDGVVLKGVDLEAESRVTEIMKYIEHLPDGISLGPPEAGGLPGIVLGVHVAENLQVTLGEKVQLLSPQAGAASPLGYIPKVRNFRVVGLFRSGMYEYDASLAYVGIPEAQNLLSMGGRVTGIEVRVRDMYQAPQMATNLVASLGGFPYRANDWIEMNSNLFSWMQTEKRVMFIILALIIMVAAFNILGALFMMVTEKRRDIGILRSMGATAAEIRSIFILEGGVIGFIGMALGTGAGLLLCDLLERYKFIKLPGDIYFIDTLPVRVETLDVLAVMGSVLVISVLATIYPAWKASRMDPVEAIRYESDPPVLLEAKDVRREFRMGGSTLHILRGVELHLYEGEILVILGSSGAGKSTLLHILGGLDRPTSGRVLFQGRDLFQLSEPALARFRNQNLGFVFQFHHLLPEFTAEENVMMPGLIRNQTRKEARVRARGLLEEVGLLGRAEHKPSELSGGEQQRIALARSLFAAPRLVLADEPTGNLNPPTARGLHDLMYTLARRHRQAWVVVTHNEQLADLADTRTRLEEGILQVQGPSRMRPAPLRDAEGERLEDEVSEL